MKKRLIALAAALILLFGLAATQFSLADFGNFDTYDSGGWDSSDSGGWSDYGSSYYDDDDSDSRLSLPSAVIVLIIIIFVIIKMKKGAATPNMQGQPSTFKQPVSFTNRNAEISEAIRAKDPSFNCDKFLSFVREAYLNLQSSWSSRDMEPMRLLLSEELFAQTSHQVEEYKRLGRVNRMERIAVQDAFLAQYASDNEKESLGVYLYATQKDYIIDEKTGRILEGTDQQFRHSQYLITFIRKAGHTTQVGGEMQARNCPNCGAPLEITSAGRCAYCGSIITNEDHDWVIAAMRRVN